MNNAYTPTLFLLPGLMCDADVWKHQKANLSDLAEIIIPELRGFDSLPAMAEAVLKQAPPRFAVAGHSMGGRVALEVFRLAPDRASRLALLETGADPITENEAEIRRGFIDLARSGGMDAVAEAWLRPMVHPDRRNDARLLNTIMAMIKRTTVDEFVMQIQALIDRPDATGYLGKIRCPTLLLAGRFDSLYPVEQHARMLQEITSARLVIVENAGHMAPMEQPEAVTGALRAWLLE